MIEIGTNVDCFVWISVFKFQHIYIWLSFNEWREVFKKVKYILFTSVYLKYYLGIVWNWFRGKNLWISYDISFRRLKIATNLTECSWLEEACPQIIGGWEMQTRWNLPKIGGGARGVMIIVLVSGNGDTSSNPGRDWLHFT